MTLTSFTCLYLHLSLSPSIPTSSYLPIFYLTGFEEGREGMGERSSGLAPLGQGLVSIAVSVTICFKCLHVIILTYLGNTSQPTCFSSLIIKIHEPACLHVNSYRYESYIYVHISIFLHLGIDSCSVLAFCNP